LLITPSKQSIEKSEKEFLRAKEIEEELKRELLIPDFGIKIDYEELAKYPYKKFISPTLILHSIEDEHYPDITENSSWEQTYMYDFYERGVLIWCEALFKRKALINDKGEWILEKHEDKDKELPKGVFRVDVRILGLLPYKNVVH